MPSASPIRRAGGLFAATALGVSATVLTGTGVAHAAPAPITSPTTLTFPSGMCTAEFVVSGASGESVGNQLGGAGGSLTYAIRMGPGAQLPVDLVTYPGGAGGVGGGDGGDGIGLLLHDQLVVVGAGGGGAGTLSDGGGESEPGGNAPGGDEENGIYTYGGGAGYFQEPGLGGLSGSGVVGGAPGGDAAGSTGGAGGGPGAGGGGGGAFGGGGGASDGTDGAGGGGARGDWANLDSSSPSTGPASITYEFRACQPGDLPEPPLAPHDVEVVGGDGYLRVNFAPTYEDGPWDGYVMSWQYSLDGGPWTEAPDVMPNAHVPGTFDFQLDGLTNGQTYSVRVRGDKGAWGEPGAASDPVPGTPYEAIGAPRNAKVGTGTSRVTFSWDAPTTEGTFDLAGYVGVLAVNNGESGGPVFFCENGPAERMCDAPAAPGLDYDVFVMAVDDEGNEGVWSDPVRAGAVPPPVSVPPSDGPLTGSAGVADGVSPGEKVTFTGSGYAPNTVVTILVYSEPQVLTSVMTDDDGAFTVEVTVPAGFPAGQHTMVAAGVDPDGKMRYLTLPVTVHADGRATLAFTGADVVRPTVGGLLAVLVGTALLGVARRRPVS